MTASIDVEQDEVLEDLAADGGVALHELHLLDLESCQCDGVGKVSKFRLSNLNILLFAKRFIQIGDSCPTPPRLTFSGFFPNLQLQVCLTL